MPPRLHIDVVADLTCPWSAVGLRALQQAIDEVRDTVLVHLQWQPFELHPQLPETGQPRANYLFSQMGLPMHTQALQWQQAQQYGQSVGMEITSLQGLMIYPTHDAHRLLIWAAQQRPGESMDIKLANYLMRQYLYYRAQLSDRLVLAEAAHHHGLNVREALRMLASNANHQEVNDSAAFYRGSGIQHLPTWIFARRHPLQGCQTREGFTKALLHMASQPSTSPASTATVMRQQSAGV